VRVERKPVIGFSDATALFCTLHAHGLGPLVHAPVLHSLAGTEPADVEHLFALLAGDEPEPVQGEPWVEGEAHGPLVGGNLCLLAAMCGTPWQLDATGAILVLEEVGEPPYRVDRLLQQIRSAGVFEGVAGVLIGDFTGADVPEGANWTMRDVLVDQLRDLGVPVVGRLPIGHGARNRAFVWGAQARIAADGTVSINTASINTASINTASINTSTR
jgi:muramoyltetrapeptide carboxypeptidase